MNEIEKARMIAKNLRDVLIGIAVLVFALSWSTKSSVESREIKERLAWLDTVHGWQSEDRIERKNAKLEAEIQKEKDQEKLINKCIQKRNEELDKIARTMNGGAI